MADCEATRRSGILMAGIPGCVRGTSGARRPARASAASSPRRPAGLPRVRRIILLSVLGLALALIAGQNASAHRTSLTVSKVTVAERTVDYRFSVSAHDLAIALGIPTDLAAPVPRSAFEAKTAELAKYLHERLRVAAGGDRCQPGSPELDYSRLPENLVVGLHFVCPRPIERLGIDYRLFFDVDPRHRGIGRIQLPQREEQFLIDRNLTELEWEALQPGPAESFSERFRRIFALGVEHILVGFDHLLFLLALLMAAARFWSTVKVVTAFTVAHSITLALAWFGVIDLPDRLVETLIALSIAYVAAGNLLGRGMERRWMVAGGFGLVHGLGFYGVLKELELGGTGVATTLLAFNLGVEAGQIAVVALAYAPLAWWARQVWYRPSANACSGLILVLAALWVVQRGVL